MGGTSTDVALIHGGMPEVSSELTIDYGLPIHVPMVDVRTVGAGGGSIAWVNAAGMLQVGPESAGSSPGPICYGRGGTRPTITDAHLLLGRLDPAGLTGVDGAGGVEPVRRAFATRDRARRSGSAPEDAAAAVLRLANTHMAGAIRMVSLSRGYDPRDFVLFAFGGAGPLHAVAIARELGMPEVVVPARPGPHQRARLPGRRPAPGFRQHHQRAARRARHGRRRGDAARAARRGRDGSTRPSRTRSSRRWCCTAPTCSSAARRI